VRSTGTGIVPLGDNVRIFEEIAAGREATAA
jgi:hypothetical protein